METREFGARLRELREQAGLRQAELANNAGVNFTYISKIESGAKSAPSEKVILRLAKVLDTDCDELTTLAGKVPSDIVEMLKSRENLQFIRSGGTQKKVRAADKKKRFDIRLRELRKQAGMTQKGLADKVDVDFTYLSKIENGVLPPPSKSVILKLAEVLSADQDELLILAGRVPSDVAEILLKNREILQLIRSARGDKIFKASKKVRTSLQSLPKSLPNWIKGTDLRFKNHL